MGTRRAGVALVVLVLVAALLPLLTHAQTAEEERDRAYSLLSDAVANREEVERQLTLAMEDYLRVANELAIKSASADRLAGLVDSAQAELDAVAAVATEQAISAYMEALITPPGVVLGTGSIEQAMIIPPTLEFLTGESSQVATGLLISQRDLVDLQSRLSAEIVEVTELQSLTQETANNLAALFAAADAEVGEAIASALAADAAYRAEMDRIEAAQAEAAEAARQQERSTTTTTAPGSSSTSLPPPPSIGDAPLKPAVEQWRGLVAAYFPAELVEPALAIMQCESLGDPNAYNPYSGASGLFQFLPGTWAVMSPKAGFAGASPFDPEPNIATAAWLAAYYESLGRDPWTPWYCTP
jgi:hypothetical protein